MYGLSGGIEGGFYQCTTEQEGPGYFTAYAPGAELRNDVIPGDNHSEPATTSRSGPATTG